MPEVEGERTSASSAGAAVVTIIPGRAYPIHDNVRKSQRLRASIQAEICNYLQFSGVKLSVEENKEVAYDPTVPPRRSGHHDDTTLHKLVTFLLSLYPGEKRGLIHVDGKLNIHECLRHNIIKTRASYAKRSS